MIRPLLIVSLFFSMIIVACSEKNATGFEDDLGKGWQEFENGNYSDALDIFKSLKNNNSNKVEVYVGLGWSYLGLEDIELANSEFNTGANLQKESIDLYAGYAVTLNILNIFDQSNEYVDKALTIKSDWEFIHWSYVSYLNLYLIKAENYFFLGNYDLSLSEVIKLSSDFYADITTYEGRASLALEIERLKTII